MKRISSFFLAVFFIFILIIFQSTPLTDSFIPLIISVLLLFFWIIFEEPNRIDGVLLALFTGLLWDLFSYRSPSRFSLIFPSSALLLKLFLYRYVRISLFR